jgi:transposase-like protein
MYDTAGGRARVTTYLTGQATSSVQRQFEAALHILHYWRDDASHGQQTTISEVEASAAVSELLRLAQFTSDRWNALTV